MAAWARYYVLLAALYSSACVAPASAFSNPTGSNSTGFNGTNTSEPVKVPCPEQWLGHSMRWQALPSNPPWQLHLPEARSQESALAALLRQEQAAK